MVYENTSGLTPTSEFLITYCRYRDNRYLIYDNPFINIDFCICLWADGK